MHVHISPCKTRTFLVKYRNSLIVSNIQEMINTCISMVKRLWVFNDTFDNISIIYHGGQFYWRQAEMTTLYMNNIDLST